MDQSALAKRFKQESIWLALGWLVVGVLLTLALIFNHLHDNQRTGERLQQRLEIIHANLAEQISTIDFLLQQGTAFLQESSDNSLSQRNLVLLPKLIPGLLTLNVLDAKGKVVQSSNPLLLGTSYAQRDYFVMAKQPNASKQLLVSSPFMGERDGWLLVVARALVDENDQFIGLFSATLSPDRFATLLSSVHYNERMLSQMVHDNGLVFLAINHHQIRSNPVPLPAQHPVQRFLQEGRSQVVWHYAEPEHHQHQLMAVRQLCQSPSHCLPLNISLSVQRPSLLMILAHQGWPLLLWLLAGLLALQALLLSQKRRRRLSELQREVRVREQQANQNWRKVLEMIGQAVWEWDRQSDQVIYSLPWKRRLGFDDTEVSNRLEEWSQRVHPDDLPMVSRALQDYVDGISNNYQCSYRLRTRTGDYLRILDRGLIIERDSRGYPSRIIGTHLDMSLLQQESTLLEQLADNLPGVLYQYRLDLNGHFSFPYASNGLEDIYGYPKDMLNSDPGLLFRLIHPDESQKVHAGLLESARKLSPWHAEYRVLLPNGRERWISDQANPVRLPDGATLWHGHLMDITASHLQSMQLAETERLLKHLMNELPIGLAMLDQNHNLYYSNRWFDRMFPSLPTLPQTLDGWLQQAIPDQLSREQLILKWISERRQAEQGDGFMPAQHCVFSRNGQPVEVSLSGLTFGHHCLIILEDRSDQHNQHAFLHTLAYQDALTGLANRRQLDESLEAEWRRCRRSSKPLSALMIDIDFFKAYNDRYGHQAGDHCLALIANTLQTCSQRAQDLVARYGGEEFVCLLPEASLPEACQLAEKLRGAIEQLNIEHLGSPVYGRVTVSIGVCCAIPSSTQGASQLVAQADQQLYQAKQSGRNRVCGCESAMHTKPAP